MMKKQFISILGMVIFVLLINDSFSQTTSSSNVLTGTLPSSPAQFLGSSNAADVIFKTTNIERMRILSNGNIGIKNSNSLAGFQYGSGSNSLTIDNIASTNLWNTSYFGFNAYKDASNNWISYGDGNSNGAGLIYGTSGGDINFVPIKKCSGTTQTNNDVNILSKIALSINNSGSIGIGTTQIGSILQVNGNAAIGYVAATNAPANGLLVNGNVGIGTTTPADRLTVNSSYNKINIGSMNGVSTSLGYATSYIGFNVARNGANWNVDNDGANNGSSMIYGCIGGTLKFVCLPSNGVTKNSFAESEIPQYVAMRIDPKTTTTSAQMYFNGKITANEVEVKVGQWFDKVFASDYKLKTLSEVEAYINENKHLPEIPSEQDALTNGNEIGKLNGLLLQKVEELTLYSIQQQKQIEEMKLQFEELKKEIKK